MSRSPLPERPDTDTDTGPGPVPVEPSPLGERVALIVLGIVVFLPYFAINRWTASWPATDLTTRLDWLVPFHPGWELVYVGVYLMVFLPAVQIRGRRAFRRSVAAFCAIQVVSYVFFLALPVGIARYEGRLDLSRGFSEWLLALNYSYDRPRNLFPSLHVANSVLGALEIGALDRRLAWPLGSLSALIAWSTVALKQHAIADVAAGALLAWLAYRLIFCPGLDRHEGRVRPGGAYPPWAGLALGAVFLALVGSFYLGWRGGWQPFPWP